MRRASSAAAAWAGPRAAEKRKGRAAYLRWWIRSAEPHDPAAHGGDGLGEGAEFDVDLHLVVEVLLDALAGGADDSEGVGLVDHQQRVVGVADLAQVHEGAMSPSME